MVTITVLNANLWLLPPPTSVDNDKRLNKFLKLVKRLDPDVITLQEVWLKKYLNKIKKSLTNYHLSSTHFPLYNKSGLATLTKSKPLKTSFNQFKIGSNFKAIERITYKGFLTVQFSKSGNLFTVLNTHIYQTENINMLETKLTQIKAVLQKAKKHNPTIIAGDFNTIPGHYYKLIDNFLTNKDFPVSYSPENKYAHKAVNLIMNKDGVYNDKPDIILANIKSKKATIKVESLASPLISDHYPMLAQITLPNGKYIKTGIRRSKNVIKKPFSIARSLLPF
jgi:endonuclease/exonuclease/phosphatase family metal-dependent hydrolase